MIVGIGVDMMNIHRLSKVIQDMHDPFFVKNYTKREIECGLNHVNPSLYFASRYAGKEAVFKALGISGQHVQFHEIEILSKETGVPYVILHGNLELLRKDRNITNLKLSLSQEMEYAIAFAVAETCEEGSMESEK